MATRPTQAHRETAIRSEKTHRNLLTALQGEWQAMHIALALNHRMKETATLWNS